MAVVVSTTFWLCWWEGLEGGMITPSFLQVTLVAGPPVDTQVRVRDGRE